MGRRSKEKQGENKGLGIMGLLNKDTQPVVEHAVQSNLKFQSMKGGLQAQVTDLQTKNFLLDDENSAVKALKDYLGSVARDSERRNYEHRIEVEKELTESSEKLRTLEKRFAELKAEAAKVQENFLAVEDEHAKLLRAEKLKRLNASVGEALLREEQDLQQADTRDKRGAIAQLEKRLGEADTIFRADTRYAEVVAENEQLRERVKRSEKELFDINYRAKEMEVLRKLAEQNRDTETELKRQAEHELDRNRVRLQERKEEFDRKMADKKNKVDAEPDLRRLQAQLTKKDKELADLRKKLETAEANYRRLREDIVKLEIHSELVKADNAKAADQDKALTIEANNAELEMNKAHIETERSENDLAKVASDRDEAVSRLRKLEEELTYLTAKYDFLEQNVHLDEDMKNVKIDELRTIAQSNLVVNDTINDLMAKWEQMRKFSREG